MKTKYIYFAVAALMVAAVAYPVAFSTINNAQNSGNPFFCAPLIPCQKQPAGSIVCTSTCTIEMKDSSFVPGEINATQGATITWINKDGFDHTIYTFNTTLIDSPFIQPGHTYSYTIPKTVTPGLYYYECTVHPFMIGLINVLPSNSNS